MRKCSFYGAAGPATGTAVTDPPLQSDGKNEHSAFAKATARQAPSSLGLRRGELATGADTFPAVSVLAPFKYRVQLLRLNGVEVFGQNISGIWGGG
jgi:hypothetical protein